MATTSPGLEAQRPQAVDHLVGPAQQLAGRELGRRRGRPGPGCPGPPGPAPRSRGRPSCTSPLRHWRRGVGAVRPDSASAGLAPTPADARTCSRRRSTPVGCPVRRSGPGAVTGVGRAPSRCTESSEHGMVIPRRQGRRHHRRRRRHRPGRARWPPRPRGPRWWWPTSAWAWPARTRRARWPRPWWPRSRPPAARPSPWPRTSPPWTAASGSSATGVEQWGRIDGVVAVAGILRERMLFNMSEDEWDAVIATHLKGHFTVFRARRGRHAQAGGRRVADRLHLRCLRRQRGPGQLRRGQGRHRVAGALRRGRPPPLRHHGQRHRAGGPHPHVGQRARRSWPRWATPRTSPRWSSTCSSDQAKHVTGQVYTVGRLEDRRVEPARRGAGHVGRRSLDARADRRAPRRRRRPGAHGA